MHSRAFIALLFLVTQLAFPTLALSDAPSFRLCEEDSSQTVADGNISALEKYGSSIPELREFLDSVGHTPTIQDAAAFFERFSELSLSRAKDSGEDSVRIMSIAYRFRLSLSVFQLDYCTHPSLLIVYDNFLSELRKIDFPLNYDPQTLEGFLFLYESGTRAVQQADVDFISQYLIDTPINRIVRDRLLALSRDPSINVQKLSQLCDALSLLGFKREVISDLGQINFKDIGCVEISNSAGTTSIDVAIESSNFLVIETNGGDLSVTTNLDHLPAFDLSSKLDRIIFPVLTPSSESSVTIPLVAVVSPENTDGSPRQYRGSFDGIVTIVHLFLVRPSNGPRDDRIAPQARRGGDLTVIATNPNLLETAIAFTSEGQLGAEFLPSAGTPEVVVDVDRGVFNSFIFNSEFLDQIGESYVPIPSPSSLEMEDLLFLETQAGRSSLDVRVRVPLEWLQFLEPDQREKLQDVCGGDIGQCISSKLEEQLTQSAWNIVRSCGGVCDMRRLGIGLGSLQPAGIDAPRRLDAPNGSSGGLKILYE